LNLSVKPLLIPASKCVEAVSLMFVSTVAYAQQVYFVCGSYHLSGTALTIPFVKSGFKSADQYYA